MGEVERWTATLMPPQRCPDATLQWYPRLLGEVPELTSDYQEETLLPNRGSNHHGLFFVLMYLEPLEAQVVSA